MGGEGEGRSYHDIILQSTPVDWWCLYWIHGDMDPSIYILVVPTGHSSLLKESSIHFGLVSISHTARMGYLKSLYTLTKHGRNSTCAWPRPWYGNELGCELVIKDA